MFDRLVHLEVELIIDSILIFYFLFDVNACFDGLKLDDQQLLEELPLLHLHGVVVLLEFQLQPVEVQDGQAHQLRVTMGHNCELPF